MSTTGKPPKGNSTEGPQTADQTTTATVRIPGEILGAGPWRAVRDDSRLGFTGRKMMGLIPVQGHFTDFTVEAQGPSSDAHKVTPPRVTIQTASIDTGIKLRDKHLRSADFLDVKRYPQIEFRAERIEHRDQDQFRISGPLTIHGVTRPIELEGHVQEHGGDVRRLHATGTLDRYQFGVKAWNPMELNLSRKVKLELELTLERAPEVKLRK